MAIFIDLWPYLLTIKLRYAQLFKWGHSKLHAGDVTPPFVASDAQMELFDAGHVSKDELISDKMLLKGIRRRNFLDICREAVSYNILR